MNEKYVAQDLEKKWQQYWEDNHTFKTEYDESKEKYYVLEMFPYPSGNLHMGHVRNYSIGDVVDVYKRQLVKRHLRLQHLRCNKMVCVN